MEISRRSRQKFADLAAGSGTVRTIEEVYAAEGFQLPADFRLPETGQRRAICAAAEATLDLTQPEVAQRLLRVYLAGIEDWGIYRGTFDDVQVDDAKDLIRALQRDGAPVDEEGRLVFGSQPPPMPVERFGLVGEPRVLLDHLQRISASVETDPAAAIASAKELVESTLRFVLDDYGVQAAPSTDLNDLYKLAAKELALSRESVPESAKGSRASHRVLQNLTVAVQSLAELRNELGLGHGRTRASPAHARHARLAANSARAVVEFILETWHERREAHRATPGASRSKCAN